MGPSPPCRLGSLSGLQFVSCLKYQRHRRRRVNVLIISKGTKTEAKAAEAAAAAHCPAPSLPERAFLNRLAKAGNRGEEGGERGWPRRRREKEGSGLGSPSPLVPSSSPQRLLQGCGVKA